jgi:DNA ligase (NAD+)
LLAGSVISRATLHNEEEIRRKNIRAGDLATIEKGGDVIPKVVSVDPKFRPEGAQPWEMPQKCPSCKAPLVKISGEVAVRCPNHKHCPEQQLRKIVYFAGKDAMDIENLGEKVIERLMQRGFVKTPSDIYKLTEMQLYQLDSFKSKAVKRLLDSIERSRNVPLAKFIMALGIKYVGAGTAELLANKAGDIDSLATMSKEELLDIEGIGEKAAGAVLEFFANESNREEIRRLLSGGVSPQKVKVKNFDGHPFYGKSFVLTGTMEKYSRSAAASLIKERGGKVVGSVSKKTDFVVVGKLPGSKLDKAKALGAMILNEAEFEGMLKDRI